MRRTENRLIDSTAKIKDSYIGKNTETREYCTVHDSEIGGNCLILERVSVKKSKIGNNVAINSGTYIEFAEISDKVLIGPNCSIVGVHHQFSEKGVSQENLYDKVFVGKNSWIGANTVVRNGVKIGEKCVVGAGSLITKDIPSGYIAIGNPMRLYSIKDWFKKKKKTKTSLQK